MSKKQYTVTVTTKTLYAIDAICTAYLDGNEDIWRDEAIRLRRLAIEAIDKAENRSPKNRQLLQSLSDAYDQGPTPLPKAFKDALSKPPAIKEDPYASHPPSFWGLDDKDQRPDGQPESGVSSPWDVTCNDEEELRKLRSEQPEN
jgi:hypothetical protein